MSDEKTAGTDATPADNDSFKELRVAVIERAALGKLVHPNNQRPWAAEDIAREYADISKDDDIEEALDSLRSAGLIYRVDDCYIASRAAIHAHELGILNL
jgi:hypothetical protein